MSPSVPLSIDRLHVKLAGKTIFRNVSLELNSKMFVTVMGENGVGKTSLISALMGYIRPSAGRVLFWNSELDGQSRASLNTRIGWVMSHREDYPAGLSVGQILKIHAACRKNWDHNFATELLARFDLDVRKPLTTLSLGEQSKVKICKALAFHPELLVLDELTANLSSESRQAITDVILERFSSGSLSVLYVCHSKEEALRLSDRVCVLTPNGLVDR
jgi:ABC-type multidrug transport system ATPase subunit